MRITRSKNALSYYGKILLAISLALFIYGAIIDISDNIKKFDSKNKKNIVKEEKDGSYTSIDSGNKSDINDNNVNNGSDHVNQEKIIVNVEDTGSDDIDAKNDNLRKTLQNKYGITILYGMETENYNVGGLETVTINNPAVINTALNNLDDTLKLYPKNMFKEISDGGIPLTIYLINNFSDETVTGATDSSYSYANISIAIVYPFGDSFYHESYHYIERYIFKRGLDFNSVTWNNYNPNDFSYGSVVDNYSYSKSFSEKSYFVNNYAQTSPEEDRASTFEYMMASSKASCLNKGNPVWHKAVIMSDTIDAVLDTVSEGSVEYWERYL